MATQTIARMTTGHADSKRGKATSREAIRQARRRREGERKVQTHYAARQQQG